MANAYRVGPPNHVCSMSNLASYTTTGNSYATAPGAFDVALFSIKVLYLSATTNDLLVQLLASYDNGATYVTVAASVDTSVTVANGAIVNITDRMSHLQVQVKPATAGNNGTLATQLLAQNF